jgi:hypothetical protein
MNEGTKTLAILQMAISADTPLTVQSEVKILEILGIVKDRQLVTAMNLLSTLVPPSTPATLKGLVQILGGLMRMSNKATASHHDSITSILSKLDAIPDMNLTFGTFLSVCQKLIEAGGNVHAPHHEEAPDLDQALHRFRDRDRP